MRKAHRKAENDSLLQDVLGIAAWALSIMLLIGIVHPDWGPFGRLFGGGLKVLTGVGAFAIPMALVGAGWILITGTRRSATRNQLIGVLILFVVIVTFCQFVRTDSIRGLYDRYGDNPDAFMREIRQGGGWLGFAFGWIVERSFGKIPGYIVLVASALISLLMATAIPFSVMLGAVTSGVRSIMQIEARPRVRRPEERTSVRPSTSPVRGLEEKRKERPALLKVLGLKREEATNGNGRHGEEATAKPAVLVRTGNEPKPASKPTTPPLPKSDSEFQLPSVALLKEPSAPPKRAQAELNYKIDKIEQTLEEFKIEADVVEVSHGPTVTRYEIQLAPGIKVNKIVSLADNLAMALAAIDVRVEAPIPGKSAIGVEVPNDNPAVVTLREVIDTGQFWNAPSKLTFALGKDVAGEPRFADLTKMPHMLIAGATNSGKSICLNALIASLLFRATPRELKFILIDPKRVELSLFDGIPHLCCPVVKDVRQAAGILRTVLKEMDKRYDKFVQMSTRNFDGYNQKVKPEERLPYLVIVVDELADLMMQAGPEVEFGICRLAQLARATGIHLVIATQRPSVDVVTGLIKANISSRLSFAVGSQIDSRTILDMGGAERLIGRGDMLFKPIDVSKPTRIQGCFVSEKEIDDLVKYLKEQESPVYTMEPSQVGDGPGGGGPGGDGCDAMTDEWYEPGVRLVVTTGYASTSMLQRRFKIGYTRAARIVDAMEEQGIVGPPDGAKPREVLITKGDLERLFGGPMFQEQDAETYAEDEEIAE